jgi:hypothetical protein
MPLHDGEHGTGEELGKALISRCWRVDLPFPNREENRPHGIS